MTYRFKRKTKMITKPILSAMVVGFVVMCSVASAQVTRSNGYTTMEENNAQTTTHKKDLSELGERLQTRLGEVWEEILGLVNNGNNGIKQTPLTAGEIIPIVPESRDSEYFGDVTDDADRYFIETLASHSIVKGSNGKFYPDNYMSVGDFIKMLVDTYRAKAGFDLTMEGGLSTQNYFGENVSQGRSKAINTAYELGMLFNVVDATVSKADFTVPVTTRMIDQMFANIQEQFPGMTQTPDLRVSDLYVKRGPAVRYVVQGFDLSPLGGGFEAYDSTQKPVFSDIYGHQYAPDIRMLAELGIINTNNSKFYPDNYLTNYEFTVMLVNALLQSKNQTLDFDYRGNLQPNLVDVDLQASYLPWINYAQKRGLIDYLIVSKRGQNFFEPHSKISKHEVYHLIGELTYFASDYDIEKADNQNMTRGGFASILVEAFGLQKPMPEESTVQDVSSPSKVSLLLQIRELLSQLES